MLQVGDVLDGRYLILKKIGGGMSTVYKAEDLQAKGAYRAIKELDPAHHAALSGFPRAELEQRFADEAKLLSRLKHPAIPKIQGNLARAGCLYVVMDWIDGQTFKEEFLTNPPKGMVPELVVCEIAEQLFQVLDYLHNLKPAIVFRDLKPSNVMIEPSRTVRLIDFGIVKELIVWVGTTRPMQMTQGIGTAEYAPREQIQGNPEPKSDIYALGFLLSALLTGEEPTQILSPSPHVKQQRPDVSDELAALIVQATKEDAKDRPTAAEMLQGIRRIQTRLNPPHPTAFTQAGQRVGQVAGGIAQAVGGVTNVAGVVLGGVGGVIGAAGSGFGAGAKAGISWAKQTVPRGGQAAGRAIGVGLRSAGRGIVMAGVAAKTWLGRQVARLNPLPLAQQLLKRRPPRFVADCERWLEPQVYAWHDAGREQQARDLVGAIYNGLRLNVSRETLQNYASVYWTLVFEDRCARRRIPVQRTALTAQQEPGGLQPIGRPRGMSVTQAAFPPPPRVLRAAAELVRNGHRRLRPRRLGYTWLPIEPYNIYTLYALVGETWYEMAV